MRNLSLSLLALILGLNVFSQDDLYKERPFLLHRFGEETTSARGICVVDSIMYLSTSTGEVIRYNLNNEELIQLSDGTKFPELRDIACFESHVVVLCSHTEAGLVFFTSNSKAASPIRATPTSWNNFFLDGMDFYKSNGFLMGDPVDGKFGLFYSDNEGKEWEKCLGELSADTGEGGFAASGTNVQVLNESTFLFVSGGSRSRFFKSTNQGKVWDFIDLPFDTLNSSGPFSVHFSTEKKGIIVGGDYLKPNETKLTSLYTKNGGKKWKKSKKQCNGYRSCVVSNGTLAFACGTNGIDISKNNGKTWKPFAVTNCLAMAIVGEKLFVTTGYGCVLEYEVP